MIMIFCSLAVLCIAGLSALIMFSYRSGRNAGAVQTAWRDRNEAETIAQTAKNMANTATNTLRTNAELKDTLKKGKF